MGHVVGGRYRLERALGEGGLGAVYAATDRDTGGKVAVKLLRREASLDAEAFSLLCRDATLAANPSNSHVVRVLDTGMAGEQAFLAMELLPGEDLAATLMRTTRLSLEQTAAIVQQLADALSQAHRAGLAHRNLKPTNIFLSPSAPPHVTVLDFGVARILQSPTLSVQTGAILSTPNYLSPEHAMGQAGQSGESGDVFALGAIVYECVTGKKAFAAPTLAGTLYQVCRGQPAKVQGFPPAVAARLDRFFAQALAKSPAERYSTVSTLCDAFVEICHSVPDASPVAAPVPRGRADITQPILPAPQAPNDSPIRHTTRSIGFGLMVITLAGACWAWWAITH